MTQEFCVERPGCGRTWRSNTAWCPICHEPVCFEHYDKHAATHRTTEGE